MTEQQNTSGVTHEQWAQARAKFLSLSTGATDASDPNMALLVHAMAKIPDTVEAVNRLGGGWEPGSLEHWARNTPVAKYAFDYAGMALNVATDGLTALYAEIVLAEVLPAYALLTLARQVNEGALRARWLLGDLSINGLVTRGFAAAWQEHKTQATYARQLIEYGLVREEQVPARRQTVSDRYTELVNEGRAHRLLQTSKRRKQLEPKVPIPHMSELFASVAGPPGPKGSRDMRWMYSLLSGVAHGRGWAAVSASNSAILREYVNYSDEGNVTQSGVVLAKADPNSMHIMLAIQVGLTNTLDVIVKMREARQLPAPR